MSLLDGKVAVVTGASRGIGLETAAALASAGARVAALVRDPSGGDALSRRLEASGSPYLVAHCDVAEFASVEAAIGLALERFGRMDILVNNAGVIEPIARIGETDPEHWHHNLAVNLLGPYHAVRAALPVLGREGGTIVNVSSGAAITPREGWSAYCAGKAGLAMLTRSIHLEYADAGIRSFGFQPGVVDTGMQAEIRASGINEVSRLRREDLAPADLPARAILYLCTDDASDLAGGEVSIRNPEFRRRAGLPDL
jgi:NAD(P)-dependent dehydrogenase (short-subunit alcohol dehydrogenase family)